MTMDSPEARIAYRDAQQRALETLESLRKAISVPVDAINADTGNQINWGHAGSMVKVSVDLKELLQFATSKDEVQSEGEEL
jgi:hypothetical protein